MMDAPLADRHLVLIGAGHTNAHVLRMWSMHPIRGVALTCVSNFATATYSGMLPAVLAGQVPESAMEIDLVRLCAAVGARLIVDQVTGIDRTARELVLRDHPRLPYDALSIGIGSVPTTAGIVGVDDHAVKIKPMQTFLKRLRDQLAVVRDRKRSGAAPDRCTPDQLQIVIVGAGAAGLEIAFCLPGFLRAHGFANPMITIVAHSRFVAPDLGRGARRRVERQLARRGIEVNTGVRVVEVTPDSVRTDNHRTIPSDLTLWATGAAPPPDLAAWDLSKDDRGFLRTDATLRVVSGDPIFVVGDTGAIDGCSLPKAGVYAVREGPVLWHNLQATLSAGPRPSASGEEYRDGIPGPTASAPQPRLQTIAPERIVPESIDRSRPTATQPVLRPYRPQKSFLKLINLGNGTAVGQWRGVSFEGEWVMRLKLAIDSRFMEKFAPERFVMGDGPAMPCRGCGCKVGASPLRTALASTVPGRIEDAARLESSGANRLIASVDFFATPLQDPFLSGRIAAIHACSDVLACGARPREALAIAVVPEGAEPAQQRFLSDLLAGAGRELDRLGAAIVGGHTISGPRAEIGFSVVGRPIGAGMLEKSGLRVGDRLYLSKPLGIGVLMAAHMRADCRAADFGTLLQTMLDAQFPLVELAVRSGLVAATDITGFGLAGHLFEMLESSGLGAEIDLAAIPLLPGVGPAIASGIESTLAPTNARIARHIGIEDSYRRTPQFRVLFDPQTCGGFLFGVSADRESSLVAEARRLGYSLVPIGRTTPLDPSDSPRIRIRGTSPLALNETR